MKLAPLTLVTAVILTIAAVLSPSASASQSHAFRGPWTEHVAGSGSALSTIVLGSRQAGRRTLTHNSSDVGFAGDISATGVEIYTVVTGAAETSRLYGYGSFAGTVGGRWGTFLYHFTGVASASSLHGVIDIDSGMDGLSGVRGVLTWQGVGSSFTYEGKVQFGRDRQPTQPAAADRFHVAGAGEGTSSTTLDSRQEGTRTLTHVISGVQLTGDIVATGTEVLTVVVDASGSVAFRGYGILAGTIAGRSGLFAYQFTGAASAGGVSGVIVFDSGREGLQALRGAVDWEGPGATFSFDGRVRLSR